jgi:hypothetical protein
VARALVVCALALLAACHGAGTPCGDGYCQTGTVCTADREHCVYPEQLTSCAGLADGTACDMRGIDGACRGEICLPIVCGDGFVQPGEEECDGAALGGHTDCLSLGEGYHQAGSLSCTSDCTLDRTACGDRCGDGITQAPLEACDVTVGIQTCESAGFHGGTLGCKPDCQLDVSSCDGWCGDGRLTSQEECDRTDFGLATCNTYGYYGGNLRCTDACKIAEDRCVGSCGDGIKNGSEVCDGDQFGGLSCQTFGWYGGTLTCGDDCFSVERAECQGYCGDGARNGNELCDGVDHEDISCTSIGAIAGALGCNAYCQPTTDACYWGQTRSIRSFHSALLTTAWGATDQDIWAADELGTVAHFDGRAWTPVIIDAGIIPARIWGVSATNVWLKTEANDLYHYDGTRWSKRHSAPDDNFVWATTPNDVWLMTNENDRDVLRHFDGASWTAFPEIEKAAEVWGSGPDDTWVGTAAGLLHYDRHWTRHDLPCDALKLWGTSSSDVWAAGSDGSFKYLFHFDGSSWSQYDTRVAISGASSLDGRTWLLGTQDLAARASSGVVRWTTSVFATSGPVWTTPTGKLWGIANSTLLVLDGTSWYATLTPDVGEITDILAFGQDEAVMAKGGSIRSFDGSAWIDLEAPASRRAGLAGTSTNDVWVLTENSAEHFNGDAWSSHPVADPTIVHASATQGVFVASPGQVQHFDGTEWSPVLEEGAIQFTSNGLGFCALIDSESTDIRCRTEGKWESLESPGFEKVRTLHLDSSNGLWAFGDDAIAYHDGAVWQRVDQLGRPESVSNATSNSPRDVWVTTVAGDLLRFDGVVWSKVSLGAARAISVARANPREVWVGTEEGQALYLEGAQPNPYGGACVVTMPAYCNVSLRGHTAQAVDGPTACRLVEHAGGELHYKIHSPVTGRLTARVTSRYDVDLSAVSADARGGCDSASCVGFGALDTEVVLDVEQGQTYFLVVGAIDGEASFTLDVSCEKR